MPVVNYRRRALGAALLAVALGVCAAMVWLVIDLSSSAVQLDTRLYIDLSTPDGGAIPGAIARLCNPTPFAYLAAIPIVIALARRRPSSALASLIIIAGATATSELLKSKLGVSHPTESGYGTYIRHSWPSGATTAATALACSLALVTPWRLRPYAALLGTAFVIAVVCSVVRLGWHYPSDAIGGVLIALTWTAATVAAMSAHTSNRLSTTR